MEGRIGLFELKFLKAYGRVVNAESTSKMMELNDVLQIEETGSNEIQKALSLEADVLISGHVSKEGSFICLKFRCGEFNTGHFFTTSWFGKYKVCFGRINVHRKTSNHKGRSENCCS